MRRLVVLALVLTGWPAAARAAADRERPIRGFALIAETKHFSFYAYGADGRKRKVDPERNERLLAEITALLGVQQTERIQYYRHDYPEEVAFHAGQPSLWAAGVAIPETATIHTVEAAHAHEIVHIVAAHLGNPGRFFQEGLAVALGDKKKLWGRPVDRMARDALGHAQLSTAFAHFDELPPEMAYPLAGSFVRYLIGRFGLARVCEFYRRAPSAGAGQEAGFQEVFGASFAETSRQWRATLQ